MNLFKFARLLLRAIQSCSRRQHPSPVNFCSLKHPCLRDILVVHSESTLYAVGAEIQAIQGQVKIAAILILSTNEIKDFAEVLFFVRRAGIPFSAGAAVCHVGCNIAGSDERAMKSVRIFKEMRIVGGRA